MSGSQARQNGGDEVDGVALPTQVHSAGAVDTSQMVVVRDLDQVLEEIDGLDLTGTIGMATRGVGSYIPAITQQEAEDGAAQLRMFYRGIAVWAFEGGQHEPQFPTPLQDLMWHLHMVDGTEYSDFWMRVLGAVPVHNPRAEYCVYELGPLIVLTEDQLQALSNPGATTVPTPTPEPLIARNGSGGQPIGALT